MCNVRSYEVTIKSMMADLCSTHISAVFTEHSCITKSNKHAVEINFWPDRIDAHP